MDNSKVEVLASQHRDVTHIPLPWTGTPLLILWADVKLFFRLCRGIPGTVFPIMPYRSGALDELFPSRANLNSIGLHLILVIAQSIFLVSVPILLLSPVPTIAVVVYFALFWAGNKAICWFLNQDVQVLESNTNVAGPVDEHWCFLNGVSVGKHWLQSNIDQLSLTFGRKITGVHNPTDGIIFDIIQCLIQRCFSYATNDVRNAYVRIKAALLHPDIRKVVFIIHSQGGIEGGMIIDWLLQELPQDVLVQLEVYTFGNAANHFNNPRKYSGRNGEPRSGPESFSSNSNAVNGISVKGQSKVIPHIEHYANSGDFVSQWGVLHFAQTQERYLGRIFIRAGAGHMLNQHYLDAMFPRDGNNRVLDHNEWADAEIVTNDTELLDPGHESWGRLALDWAGAEVRKIEAELVDVNSPETPIVPNGGQWPKRGPRRVKDVSRLWRYRNGGSPDE